MKDEERREHHKEARRAARVELEQAEAKTRDLRRALSLAQQEETEARFLFNRATKKEQDSDDGEHVLTDAEELAIVEEKENTARELQAKAVAARAEADKAARPFAGGPVGRSLGRRNPDDAAEKEKAADEADAAAKAAREDADEAKRRGRE